MVKIESHKILLFILTFTLFACASNNSPLNSNDDVQITPVSFVKSTQLFNLASVYEIAAGDLDNDGDLDVVFSIMGSGSSRVLLNDGSGYFTYTDQYLTQQGHGVGINDFDGDGDLDLFITCAHYGSPSGDLSRKPSKVYLNDGTGQFTDSGQDIGDTNDSGNGLNLVDINNDGYMDVHVYYFNPSAWQFYHKIFINDGNANFSLSDIQFPSGTELWWSDLDADNDTDVFIRDWNGYLKVMLNDGSGYFSDRWQAGKSNTIEGHAAFADLDNDGDVDVINASGSVSQYYPTLVFLNDGTGHFSQTEQELFSSSLGTIIVGDLNGDGSNDFFLSNFNAESKVYLNDGNAGFVISSVVIGENETHGRSVLGDFNGDGKLDIFLAVFGEGAGRSSLWFNQ